jgi:hypothetical protein
MVIPCLINALLSLRWEPCLSRCHSTKYFIFCPHSHLVYFCSHLGQLHSPPPCPTISSWHDLSSSLFFLTPPPYNYRPTQMLCGLVILRIVVHFVFLGGSIAWKTKKQTVVSRLCAEAKLRAPASSTTKQPLTKDSPTRCSLPLLAATAASSWFLATTSG